MKRRDAETWRVHRLKVWPFFFREIAEGRKHTEFRKHDRDFRPGDRLLLREYHPLKKEYTGRCVWRVVVYAYPVDNFAPGYSVLELAEPEEGL